MSIVIKIDSNLYFTLLGDDCVYVLHFEAMFD